MTTTTQQTTGNSAEKSQGRSFLFSPTFLITIVILIALGTTVSQYHAAGTPTADTSISNWTTGTPEISPRTGLVGGFSGSTGSNHGGGLFTIQLPINDTDSHEVTLHLVNAAELNSSYLHMNMLISLIPAVNENGTLVQRAEVFTAETGTMILNPDKGSVSFSLQTTTGTITDLMGRTSDSPDFTGGSSYSFNIGISGGSYSIFGSTASAPQFILDID